MIIYSQKYYNKYFQIVKHYKDLDLKKSKELYTENHHIIPKSMGGDNSKENLVRVPARVHFLLHWMLYRIYKTYAMLNAWQKMRQSSSKHIRYISKSYAYIKNSYSNVSMPQEIRDKISKSNKGKVLSEDTKKKMSLSKLGDKNPFYGKSFTEEQIQKIKDMGTGRKHSDKTKYILSENHSGDKNPFYGKTHSDETKKKLSKLNKGKVLSEDTKKKLSISIKLSKANVQPLTCPHCNLTSKGISAMKTHHFDKCKKINVFAKT